MSLRKRCAVLNCPNSVPGNVKVRYFSFPKNDTFRQKWIHNIENPELMKIPYNSLKNKYLVCENHFEDFHFQTPEKLKLNRNAVPALTKEINTAQQISVVNNIEPLPSTSRYEETGKI